MPDEKTIVSNSTTSEQHSTQIDYAVEQTIPTKPEENKLTKLIDKWKPVVMDLFECTTFFVIIYIGAWILNGIYQMHFDLSSLQNFYLAVIGKQTVTHGINSYLNSPKDSPPSK